MASCCSKGRKPNSVQIALGLAQSSIARISLYVGGLTALQNTIIAAALPFSFIMILMMISLIKALNKEVKTLGRKK